MKKMLFWVVLLFVFAGCANTTKSTKTGAHRFLENAGIDWVNF